MELLLFGCQIFQFHIILRQLIFIVQEFNSFSMPLNQSNGQQWIDGIIKSGFSTQSRFKTDSAVTAVDMITVKRPFIAGIVNFPMFQ